MTIRWPDKSGAAWAGRLIPVLGIAVLAIYLFAGFAQAAEAAREATADGCGSAMAGCYAELEHNGYWYTTYLGTTETECYLQSRMPFCAIPYTFEDCSNAFPRYDIVATVIVKDCD